jgi:tRNA pseudouridine38-40 synthase
LNDELPADINILAATEVPHRFHARHDAVARRYLYQIARRRSAFAKTYVWWVREPIDVSAMRDAASAFVGMRDFKAFAATADPKEADESPPSTLVLIDRVDIIEDGALVLVGVEGSHFLWKMVRRMVGFLVAIGRGEAPPVDPARFTAPPSGLFLERVYYKGDVRADPLRAATPLA